jgi:hypothetical protein
MLELRMKRGLNAEMIASLALSLSPPGGERVSGRTGEGIVFGFSDSFLLALSETVNDKPVSKICF